MNSFWVYLYLARVLAYQKYVRAIQGFHDFFPLPSLLLKQKHIPHKYTSTPKMALLHKTASENRKRLNQNVNTFSLKCHL